MAAPERTLSIARHVASARFEKAGPRIVALEKIRLCQGQAEGFYAAHHDRPRFQGPRRTHNFGVVYVDFIFLMARTYA